MAYRNLHLRRISLRWNWKFGGDAHAIFVFNGGNFFSTDENQTFESVYILLQNHFRCFKHSCNFHFIENNQIPFSECELHC